MGVTLNIGKPATTKVFDLILKLGLGAHTDDCAVKIKDVDPNRVMRLKFLCEEHGLWEAVDDNAWMQAQTLVEVFDTVDEVEGGAEDPKPGLLCGSELIENAADGTISDPPEYLKLEIQRMNVSKHGVQWTALWGDDWIETEHLPWHEFEALAAKA